MANALHQTGCASESMAASITRYGYLGNGCPYTVLATESSRQVTWRAGGVFSNLYVNVFTNDRGTSTLRTRKGGANGSLVATITASTTGKFEDTTNSDTVTAADLWCYSMVTGAGGTVFTFGPVQVLFAATSNTVSKFTATGAATTTASTTTYKALSGTGTHQVTESFAAFRVRSDGTLKNGLVISLANARTTTTTFKSRINSVDGNISIDVTAGTTGQIEEGTPHSDTVTSGQDINMSCTTSTGSESFTNSVAADYETTNGASHLVSGGTTGTIAASATTYSGIAGLGSVDATEANVASEINLAFTASKLQCNVSANTIVGAGTLVLRKNAGAATQSASITGLTTGWFLDNTNTDAIVASDSLAYQINGGAAGTSMTIRAISILATVSTGGGPIIYGGEILKSAVIYGGRIIN